MKRDPHAAFALVLAAAAFGCHKQSADSASPPPSNQLSPEPVAKQPSPDPAPSAGAVRPPTAADLADYTKDLQGTGTKLLAQLDTSLGTIHCELYGDKAPMTVANFIGLATGKKAWIDPRTGDVQRNKPYFDGLTFHRVIPDFMIQGGDPLGEGNGGPGYEFANEISPDLKTMDPGTMAMANAGPGTNGSQFFIMEGSKPALVGNYSIFGQCSDPDVVSKITHVPRNSQDKPDTAVTITKVTITKG